jgi:hypothetical protein
LHFFKVKKSLEKKKWETDHEKNSRKRKLKNGKRWGGSAQRSKEKRKERNHEHVDDSDFF